MAEEEMGGGLSRQQAALTEWAKSYFCGFVAGASGVYSGYPFDALKVRVQVAPDGLWRTARRAYRSEGLGWLFRGATAPALGTGLETGINYLIFTEVFKRLGVDAEKDDVGTVVKSSLFAGALAGFPVAAVIGPVELLKCRAQLSHKLNLPAKPSENLRHILRHEGWRGLMRGQSATLLREVPGNGIFFAVYNGVHKKMTDAMAAPSSPDAPSSSSMEGLASLMAGGISGCAYWSVIFPIDLVKTRIQASSDPKTFLAELTKVYRGKGIRGLYSGLTPTLVRAFPANAVQWLAWDLSTKFLNVK